MQVIEHATNVGVCNMQLLESNANTCSSYFMPFFVYHLASYAISSFALTHFLLKVLRLAAYLDAAISLKTVSHHEHAV
jgi:hypothetical protein